MPRVRDSGQNWTFSSFQAREKLLAVKRGGTLEVLVFDNVSGLAVFFFLTCLYINTYHPISFDIMLML